MAAVNGAPEEDVNKLIAEDAIHLRMLEGPAAVPRRRTSRNGDEGGGEDDEDDFFRFIVARHPFER